MEVSSSKENINKETNNLQTASPSGKSTNSQSPKNSSDMPNHDKNNNLNKTRSSRSKFAFVDDYNRYLKYEYYDVDVKGIKYRDFDISKIEINHQLYFNHESENQYDPNAIQVLYDDLFIGYIPTKNDTKL